MSFTKIEIWSNIEFISLRPYHKNVQIQTLFAQQNYSS